MIFENSQSVFDEGFIDSTLKNPNLFTEAVIFDEISRRSASDIKNFCRSNEAKMMIEAGVISQGTIERLDAHTDDHCKDISVCHIASENEDPLWQELIMARREERRIMNELLNKYGNNAEEIGSQVRKEIIEKKIPTKFIINED